MTLLNYTTKVPAHRTVSEIQRMLVGAGAREVAARYDDDEHIVALHFTIPTEYGPRTFTLPIRPDAVLALLQRERVEPRYATPERAQWVAWRIVKDWVEAQLAIVATEMVTLDQVMLPYMHDASGSTVYELYRSMGMAELEAGR